jgi:hypothetical protein
VPAPDRLAEKIIGAYFDLCGLSRQVKGAVRLDPGREVRQVIAADLDPVAGIRVFGAVVPAERDDVVAEACVLGDRPVNAGNAEARSL